MFDWLIFFLLYPPPPLPHTPHVFPPHFPPGEARGVQVSGQQAASVPGGQLPLPPQSLLPQVPGADGVCPPDHRAGGGAVMGGLFRLMAAAHEHERRGFQRHAPTSAFQV